MAPTTPLKGKRFLITQNSLRLIAGSEVATLELAEYLLSQGAEVTVYTYYFEEPISKYFKGIKVIENDDGEQLKMLDFDYVWVHHQVLPLSFIHELGQKQPKNVPIFIFQHMSALPHVFLEHPYIWGLEDRLSSLSVFASLNTQEKLLKYYSKAPKTALFQNPVPLGFVQAKSIPKDHIDKVLIVSNHPPEEVVSACEILREKGYDVDLLGKKQERHELLTAQELVQYDAVITIGKTVQYCLTAGVPVYVYDHFGGPGYLNENNYKESEDANFSGRNAKRKTAERICLL